ncbi:MAG: ribonuclease Z [Planctomycetota bacterium]
MSAELAVLGAGSILPRVDHGPAGYALRPGPGAPVTLLDCGPGSLRALARVGVAIGEVQRVVFSHYHLDHCLDLLALFFARRNPRLGTLPPLFLHGPPGLRRLVERAPEVFGAGAVDPDCRVQEVEPGSGFAGDGMEFLCAPTGHTESPPSVAWRVALPDGASLTYTGDTGEVEAVAVLAAGTDTLLAECSFPDGEGEPQHLTPAGAARLARAAGAGVLVLTHFYPAIDPAAARAAAARVFLGPVAAARDGTVFSIGRMPRRGT